MKEETVTEKKTSLSFWSFLSTIKWMYVFNFKLSPWTATFQFIIRILLGVSPIFNAYIYARLIDKIISIASTHSDLNGMVPLLAILLAYNILTSGLNSLYSFITSIMSDIYNFRVSVVLAEKINSLGIQTLENPDSVNKIQRARETISMLNSDYERTILFISRVITLVSTSLIIFSAMPILALAIVVAIMPEIISNRIHMRRDWNFWRKYTEERRKANAVISSLNDTSNLHEITITSSFQPLKNLYKKFADFYITESRKIDKSWQFFSFVLGSMSDVAVMYGYYFIFSKLFYGLVTVGTVTFQVRMLDMFTSNISNVLSDFSVLYERSMRMNEVKIVFEMQPFVKDGTIHLSKHEGAPVMEMKDVSFKYPGADRYVIENLNLTIKPGEKIAIVGENGAGKTTLVKLLSRFYKVDQGEILLDGKNINEIAIDSWYKTLGVLFQDFNTYPSLSLTQNIQLGDYERPVEMTAIENAAKQANVDSFVKNYKNGYEQILSEKFKGGTRPSAGQWQKIAIARFFYRNSPVVIFDEPTASIDPVSEAEIFGKIYEFFQGKTVIIISHRFSTVRNADKIYVLDKGKIVENGSHDELMNIEGKYKEAFNIQANGYK